MEEFCDSFGDLRDSLVRTVPNVKPTAGTTVLTEETNIDDLISALTGSAPKQTTNSTVSSVREPQLGESVVLGDPTNFDEILAVDEALIPSTSHNVSVLNVACQQVLKQMEHQLLSLLKKNRKEQEIIQNYLSTNCKSLSCETAKRPYIKCTGMPYFKDREGFQPPPNEDILRKIKNNKLLPANFIKSFPLWNSTDAKKLISAVKQYDAAKPSTIDWLKISVTDMQGKYSPSECKAKWLMHLNPTINRSKWSLKEMELLKELSVKYNYQNWDKIAEELGTNRNALQCCVQYQTHTVPTEGKWTKEEDETLKNLVEKYKVRDCIPWKKVAWHFEDRTLKQCQERYAYHLGNIKKGIFTVEEDFVLVYLASKLRNFGEVAKFLPNRVSTQLRARYEYLVEISMPKFSKEEDELLSKLMVKYPRNWGKISESFKNRSRIQCRRRWAYLQRKIHLDTIGTDSENDECGDSLPEAEKSGIDKCRIDAENLKKKLNLVSNPVREAKKRPEVYRRLLDYHKNCYKFLYGPKPRIPSNSEDLNKLTAKMAVTMKNLSVTHAGPLSSFKIDTLSNNCEFDKEDFAILKGLNPSEASCDFELSRKFIPPNYMTLVALRTFTLGWNAIKNSCVFHAGVPPESNQTDSKNRILCSDAKKLFKSRLKTVFAYPLILSNILPDSRQKTVLKPKARKSGKPLSKRKRKEHAKLMSAAYRNKLKTLGEELRDAFDALPIQETESPESNKRKRKKPVKSATKSRDDSGEGGNANGNRKRTRSVKTDNGECVTPLKKRATRNAIAFRSE